MRRVLLPALLVFPALPLLADPACNVPAFVASSAPGAPVIVDAPADGAADLGAMPMVQDPDRGRVGPSFMITEISNGYAHVNTVRAFGSDKTAPDGWVATTDLAVVAQTTKGFAAPDPSSAVVWQSAEGLATDQIVALTGCQGAWVELRLHGAGQTPVWLRGLCDLQQPNCDGAKGD